MRIVFLVGVYVIYLIQLTILIMTINYSQYGTRNRILEFLLCILHVEYAQPTKIKIKFLAIVSHSRNREIKRNIWNKWCNIMNIGLFRLFSNSWIRMYAYKCANFLSCFKFKHRRQMPLSTIPLKQYSTRMDKDNVARCSFYD